MLKMEYIQKCAHKPSQGPLLFQVGIPFDPHLNAKGRSKKYFRVFILYDLRAIRVIIDILHGPMILSNQDIFINQPQMRL